MTLWSTSIGKKAVMAVTGLILVGFVIGHMLGNLKVFQGEAKFNAYAAWLREIGSPAVGHAQVLWLARLILLTATVLHIVAAVLSEGDVQMLKGRAVPIPADALAATAERAVSEVVSICPAAPERVEQTAFSS